MIILGIAAYYHDSSATLIIDGKIIAAAQEERFTRIKNDASFPTNAVTYCLEEAGINIDQLNAVSYYEKPLLKFERILYSFLSSAPRGYRAFIKSIPIWVKQKLMIRQQLKSELFKIQAFDKKKLTILFPSHHLSHAASAFYPSPYDEAAIVTIDGVGEWNTTGIFHGKGHRIKEIETLDFPHSLGLLYSAFTYFLGFKVNSGEYKMMGLAPYGNATSNQTLTYIESIKTELISLESSTLFELNLDYFEYTRGSRMINEKKWSDLFGISRRGEDEDLERVHCNLAFAIQAVTEEAILHIARKALSHTGLSKLCLAGGVALNCVANGKLLQLTEIESLYVQPAAGDSGGSLGAAFAAYHIYFDKKRKAGSDQMQSSLLGPYYTDKDIKTVLANPNVTHTHFEKFDDLAKVTAEMLSQEKVIGWFQGRMEFGPRALGNRSILGDPRSSEMQLKLNLKIKSRESFRPFAPVMLESELEHYFDIKQNSPYMLLVEKMKAEHCAELPDNYPNLTLKEKLYFKKSTLPAITHVDNSSRIQTVSSHSNPKIHILLQEFKRITGIGVLINTSFNVKGEPMVCSPEDAINCFLSTQMDYLVINNHIFEKSNGLA